MDITYLTEEINQINTNQSIQDSLNKVFNEFVDIVKSEMDNKLECKVFNPGIKNKKRRIKKPWWNNNLTELWNKMSKAEKEYTIHQGKNKQHLRNLFVSARKVFDRHVQRVKRCYWYDQQQKFQKLESGDQKAFWKEINIGLGSERKKEIPMEIITDNGSVNSNASDVLNKWNVYFSELLNPINVSNESSVQHIPINSSVNVENFEVFYSEISLDEIFSVIKSAKSGKAAGYDEIPMEVLRNNSVVNYLVLLFNICFTKGIIPDMWRKGIINPVSKSSTKDPRDPSGYRGITLAPSAYKLYCNVLNNRLVRWENDNNILSDKQNGFRKNRSTVDHICTLTSIIENRKLQNKSTFTAFIDFRKAYDSIDRCLLFDKLRNIGICGYMYNALVSIYSNVQCCVRINGFMSDWFQVKCGLKQGCILSPLLFNLYINDLVSFLDTLSVGVTIGTDIINCLFYADDLVLLAESPSDLQLLLDKLEVWTTNNKMSINFDKSNIVHFRNSTTRKTLAKFSCAGNSVSVVDHYIYLGVLLHEHLDYSFTAKRVAASANRALGLLIAKFKSTGGLPFKTFTKLYENTVVPIITYSSAVWGYKQFPCIDAVQNKASRFFLGLRRYASNTAVQGDMGWTPIFVKSWDSVIRQYRRFCDMDDYRLNKRVFLWADNLKHNVKNWNSFVNNKFIS